MSRMERDLQAAKRIQGALLRPVPTDDYGLRCCGALSLRARVCGDLYDFLALRTATTRHCAGDVSGKGNCAALYWRRFDLHHAQPGTAKNFSPPEMLRQMNQPCRRAPIEGRFNDRVFCHVQKGRQKLASPMRPVAATAL